MFKFLVFALLAAALADYTAMSPRDAIEAIANVTDEATRSDLMIEEILLVGEPAPVRLEDAYEMEKMGSTEESTHIETPDIAHIDETLEETPKEKTESELTLEETPEEMTHSELPIEGTPEEMEHSQSTIEGTPEKNEDELTLGENPEEQPQLTVEPEEPPMTLGGATRASRSILNATEDDDVIAPIQIQEPVVIVANETDSEWMVITDDEEAIEEIMERFERAADNETEASGNATCKGNNVCYSDAECGENGHCLGMFVGKCNCDACFNFMTCTEDSACGGLKNACNVTESRCNCIEGHKANGFPLFIDALRELCNTQACTADTDTCFGLPCRSGRCVC